MQKLTTKKKNLPGYLLQLNSGIYKSKKESSYKEEEYSRLGEKRRSVLGNLQTDNQRRFIALIGLNKSCIINALNLYQNRTL